MERRILGFLSACFLSFLVFGPQATLAAPSLQGHINSVRDLVVTHPTGAGKPLTPDNNLLLTVTGVTEGAKGSIELFSDTQAHSRVDRFDFTLNKGQAMTHFVVREHHAVWARILTYRGSFQVRLDQSADVQSMQAPQTVSGGDAVVSKTPDDVHEGVTVPQPAIAAGPIVIDDVPLFPGARVVQTKTYGAHAKAQLRVEVGLHEIIDFYRQAMTAKGWETVMSMVQGNQGVLALKKPGRQLIFKAKKKEKATQVDIASVGQ